MKQSYLKQIYYLCFPSLSFSYLPYNIVHMRMGKKILDSIKRPL